MPSTSTILTVLSLLVTVGLALYIRHLNQNKAAEIQKIRDEAAAKQGVLDRLGEVEKLYAALQGQLAQSQPIYSLLLEKAIGIATHPSRHFKLDDEILAKTLNGTLTEEERINKLEPLCIKRVTDPNPEITDEERVIVGLIPALAILRDMETSIAQPPAEIVLVSNTNLSGKTEEKQEGAEE